MPKGPRCAEQDTEEKTNIALLKELPTVLLTCYLFKNAGGAQGPSSERGEGERSPMGRHVHGRELGGVRGEREPDRADLEPLDVQHAWCVELD